MSQGSFSKPARDAERAVLGSMVRNNGCIGEVVQIVRVENFYLDAHQRIFSGIVSLWEKGKPVDLVSLADELKSQIGDIGGYGTIGELWDAATGGNAEYYAKVVRDEATIRSLGRAAAEIADDVSRRTGTAEEMVEAAEKRIFDIATVGMEGQAVHLSRAVDEACDRIDARQNRGSFATGVPTGLMDLDRLTCGLQDAEFIILGARPSTGKTACSLTIAKNVAMKGGMPVFFVSLEQKRAELAERLMVNLARVDSHKLRGGRLSQEDVARLLEAAEQLRVCPIHIDDTPAQSMLRIGANARRLKMRHNIRLVVVDYIQLIRPSSQSIPRHEQVAEISHRLKDLARELNVPVMALSQLNRASEDRPNQRPRLADLKESSALEQDADTVFLLHRPADNDGVIELLVEKQRNGPIGEVTLAYQKEFMAFENFAHNLPNDLP